MGLFDNYNFSGDQSNPLQGLLSLIGQQSAFDPQSAGLPPVDGPQSAGTGSPFDPATYAPSGPPPGGTGFYGQTTNVPVGNYLMPQFGNAPPTAVADNAQLPQNAQPTQFQPPQPTDANFGDRLLAGLSGFGEGGRTGGLIGAITGGAEGLANGVSTQNQTAQALIARGVEPAIAQSIVRNPALLKAVLPQILKGNTTEYGLNPIYGTDPVTGEQVLGTIGKNGTFKKIDTGGIKIQSGVDKIDLGTHFQLRDKRTGQVIGVEPKDLKGAETQKALGKAQGGMQASLPSDIQNAEQTIQQIDQLIANPGLDSIVGPIDQFRPSYTLDANGRDALARYNQLKGKAFLSAYATLRGGGQITEVEGTKAENAMARMDRAQSEADFKAALTDFRDAVRAGMEKLREKAGVAGPAATTASTPAASSAPDGAIAALRQNPSLAAQFDAKYGAGSAQKILGGR